MRLGIHRLDEVEVLSADASIEIHSSTTFGKRKLIALGCSDGLVRIFIMGTSDELTEVKKINVVSSFKSKSDGDEFQPPLIKSICCTFCIPSCEVDRLTAEGEILVGFSNGTSKAFSTSTG
jgi:hypothetical protein